MIWKGVSLMTDQWDFPGVQISFGMRTWAAECLVPPLPFPSTWETMLGGILKMRIVLPTLLCPQAHPAGQTILARPEHPSSSTSTLKLSPARRQQEENTEPRVWIGVWLILPPSAFGECFIFPLNTSGVCLSFPSSTSTALLLIYSKVQFIEWRIKCFIICP